MPAVYFRLLDSNLVVLLVASLAVLLGYLHENCKDRVRWTAMQY